MLFQSALEDETVWTYDPGLATSKDEVRFLIGDVVPSRPLLEDEEIFYLLQISGDNVKRAAAEACERIAARISADPTFAVGQWREDRESVVRRYQNLASKFRAQVNYPVLSQTSGIQPYFKVGMMDYTDGEPWSSR